MENDKLSENEREMLQKEAREMFEQNPTGESVEKQKSKFPIEKVKILFEVFFKYGYELGRTKSSIDDDHYVYTDADKSYTNLFMKLVEYLEKYEASIEIIKDFKQLLRAYWMPYYSWRDWMGAWKLYSESHSHLRGRVSYINNQYKWYAGYNLGSFDSKTIGRGVEESLEDAIEEVNKSIDKYYYNKYIGKFDNKEDNPWFPSEDRNMKNIPENEEVKFDIHLNGRKIKTVDESQLTSLELHVANSGDNNISIIRRNEKEEPQN